MTASSPVSSAVSQNLSMSVGSTGFLYVFATAGTYTGALGNREEANSLCSSELTGQNSAAACDRTVALVSVSESDSIANLPALSDLPRELPLKSINGTILAHSWAELMDGTLQSSLLDADIDAGTWWSGADHQGNTRDNCDGWTSRSGNASGRYGGGTATDQDWINKGSSPCDRERHVLCLCVPSSQPWSY